MKKRGDIWWVNFDPSIGQEVRKKRPAVILSNDISNRFLKRYQVVPLSSQLDKLYPSECLVTVHGRQSKAMADQLTTVSEKRFLEQISTVNHAELIEIEKIVRLQLDLD